MTGWRPALRIARRSVTKHLARSILIAALIGVPVAGATLVDVVARTLGAPAREAERSMGAADFGVAGRQRNAPALSSLLPPGSRVVNAPAEQPVVIGRKGTAVVMSAPEGPVLPGGGGHVMISGVQIATLLSADPNDPMHRQAVRITEGRAPANDHEALVSEKLAQHLNLHTGSTIQGPKYAITITGIAKPPFCLTCEQVVQLPNGTQNAKGLQLVQLPPGTDRRRVEDRLKAAGYAFADRDGENSAPQSSTDLRAAALVTLIAGFGLLEVILLAGTAFAVGARRQTRTLGLVAASGGEPRHVRRIVLAEGVVLGALGAAAGVAVGIVVALALHPLWQHLDDAEITTWVINPVDITAAALVGVLSGVAAAALPAIGAARMQPIDALAGRFRVSAAASRGVPLAGVILLAGGIAAGLAGNGLLAGDFKTYERALAKAKETGAFVTPPTQTGAVAMTLLGATLLVAAIVLLAPAVIGRLARAGTNLPVAGRLAVRDAARHRHRTGPTTSAIAVAVAGSVVLACVLAANWRAQQLQHLLALPPHTMTIEPSRSSQAQAAKAASAQLPDATVLALRQPLGPDVPPDTRGPRPGGRPERMVPVGAPDIDTRGLYATPECRSKCAALRVGAPLALADAASMKLTGLEEDAKQQLARGRIVVFGTPGSGGAHTVTVESGDRKLELPGYVVERKQAYIELPIGLVPETVAKAQGWEIVSRRLFITYGAKATRSQVQNALDAAASAGAIASIEEEPTVPNDTTLLIVVAAAAFITLAGAAIAIALSAAEGRADLATLAAVGAAPRRRRALAAGQALLIAGTGCALGVLLGMFVAYTIRATTGAPGFVVPWLNVAATAIVVPLLAMAVAALFTPSRLPLVRRAA